MIAALAATLDPARFERHAEAGESGSSPTAPATIPCASRVPASSSTVPGSPAEQAARCTWRQSMRASRRSTGSRRCAGSCLSGWTGNRRRRQRGGNGTALDAAADWGPEGEEMAWCCTEGPLAYVSDRAVIDSLGAELEAIVGSEVYVELRRRIKGQ